MEAEAREIATWADNVYVKIPALNTKGESTAALVKRLSADGIKVNVTTIFTPEQVDEFVDAVSAETPLFCPSLPVALPIPASIRCPSWRSP